MTKRLHDNLTQSDLEFARTGLADHCTTEAEFLECKKKWLLDGNRKRPLNPQCRAFD